MQCQPSPHCHQALNVGPWVPAAADWALAGDARRAGAKSIPSWVSPQEYHLRAFAPAVGAAVGMQDGPS